MKAIAAVGVSSGVVWSLIALTVGAVPNTPCQADWVARPIAVAASIAPDADPVRDARAIVDATQMKTVMGYIEAGKAAGARLLSGGEAARADSGGFYIAPTLFDQVDSSMSIAREEIFGPVLSVLSFTDIKDAIRQANSTPYGLQAAVWTRDLTKAIQTARALHVGGRTQVWEIRIEDAPRFGWRGAMGSSAVSAICSAGCRNDSFSVVRSVTVVQPSGTTGSGRSPTCRAESGSVFEKRSA